MKLLASRNSSPIHHHNTNISQILTPNSMTTIESYTPSRRARAIARAFENRDSSNRQPSATCTTNSKPHMKPHYTLLPSLHRHYTVNIVGREVREGAWKRKVTNDERHSQSAGLSAECVQKISPSTRDNMVTKLAPQAFWNIYLTTPFILVKTMKQNLSVKCEFTQSDPKRSKIICYQS